ncbi:MAG: TolC family protein [Deltaproteobacteria bacterium]
MLDRSNRIAHKKPIVRRLFCCRWSAGLTVASLLVSAAAAAAPILTEVAGTLQVCRLGPDAALARAMRSRGAAEVTAAGVLPNPSLVLEHQRAMTGPVDRETIAGLSVPLGVSGRRSLIKDAAAARREGADADADATLFESALAFREAYLTALVDQARAEILSEQQLALEASSGTMEALAKSGEAAGYDLLRQRVQARLHRGSVESARARALASRASLEAWIETEVELPNIDLAVLAHGGISQPPSEPPSPSRRVRSLRAASRASALEARAARRRWVPDPDVFAGYRALDQDGDIAHGVSLGLTIPLTFFDHGQGEAALADAEREALEAGAERLSRQQRADAKAARVQLQQLTSNIEDLGQVRDDARELLTQAQRLYSAGETSITEMLEAFRVAEDARLAEIDRVSEIALTRLLVMRASGSMFDPSLDQACTRPGPRKP